MPLTLVLGPANSAKAGEVLGAYAAARRQGALLVVPTTLDQEHYARELAEQGTVLGAVLTFRGLIEQIAQRAGFVAARLSSLQRRRVVRRITSDKPPGYTIVAENLIAELERALITPERFARALPGDEASELYVQYARELERIGRLDQDLYAWRAIDALRANPGAWGHTPVFFYGFDDFSGIERDAIETLCRVVGVEVTASLTFEPGRAALTARAEVVQELRALAERVVELPALDEHYAEASRVALHHLERFLFEPGPKPQLSAAGTVRLLEAGGELAEAELIADEVLALLRDGVPASEIVVVCRSLTASAPVIEHVFARYGIALRSERRLRLAHTALGRSVVALVRCALLGLDTAAARDLVDYLRAPGLLQRTELADRLEAQAAREGLRTARQVRDRLDWELQEFDSLREAKDRLVELGRQARRLFAAPHRGAAPTLEAREEHEANALATLLRALKELQELGERPSATELIDLLEGLELPEARRARTGGVLLAEPLGIRARRFQAVFVCALNESEFPRPGATEPFLPDERRRELFGAGLRLSASEDALNRERYLFYACVSRATEQLVLSYRSSDEEGNLSLASPFVADVAELFGPEWRANRRRRLLADVVWPVDAAPTEREHARALAAAMHSGTARQAPERTLGEAALRLARHSQVVSAGALEKFADCPIKWLVESELSPKQLEPESDPLTRGSYMHEVLEEVIGRLEGPVTPESLPDALAILSDVLAEAPPTLYPGRPGGIRAGALRGIEADLSRYLVHEAADGITWQPHGLELRFGFEEEQGSLPPLLLDGVRIRGMIDRVDANAGRAIVRDYKTGGFRNEYPGARWQADRQLQVALYMIAVRELLGLEPVAGLYQPLGGKDLRPRGVYKAGEPVGDGLVSTDAREPDELEHVLDDAADRATTIAGRLRSGKLTPCPQTCSRDGCRYPGICRST